MHTETDYRRRSGELFALLEDKLNAADIDYDIAGDVMEIIAEDGDKFIINLQPPLRQVWLAAKSGGHHFQWQDGDWRDTRDGTTFFCKLSSLLGLKAKSPDGE